MKRLMMIVAIAVVMLGGARFCATAYAAVTVTNVTCQQRYPWNGMVDIDYEIQSDQPNALFWIYPKGTDNWLGKRVIMNTFSGDGATNAVGVGKHRMVWDAKTDMPTYHTKDLQVTLQVISDGAKYVVVDISGGTNAVTYPVRYSTEGPNVGDDTCRTDEIWLRLILPGTFTMGSPDGEERRQTQAEEQHQVTLTKPYYIAIFELTQKQWLNVMGTVPSANLGDTRPVECVSYNDLRGEMLGAQWPTSLRVDYESFMGVLRRKTSLTWDLPTEAQWEYACRAGTTTPLNTGLTAANNSYWEDESSSGLNATGRYRNNNGNNVGGFAGATAKVGIFPCNNWGLYDMHGNVSEWCRDYYNAYVGSAPVMDPVGWNSGSRSLRSGNWNAYANKCRSASRSSAAEDQRVNTTGFRPDILPFE